MDKIRQWSVPKKSNVFKNYLEGKHELIYPNVNEKMVENNVANIREQEITEKLNNLSVFQKDRICISNRVKSLITPFVPSYFLKWKFFVPFRHYDYEISEEAHVEIDEFDLLSPEMENQISEILTSENRLLVTGFAMNVYTNDLITLYGQNWLNDVVC